MIEWSCKIDTLKAESFFPRVITVCKETIESPSYYWDNAHRSDKPHLFFQYTIAGQGVVELDNQQFSVLPGQGFIMRVPAENTKYYYPPLGTEPWSFIYLCFSGADAENIYSQMTSKYGIIFNLDPNSEIIKDIIRLRYLENRTINASSGALLVYRLFTALTAGRSEIDADVRGNLLINEAKHYITANFHNQINVFDTARAIGVSREHLTRIFKAYLGITPHDYIEKERIYTACILLRDASLSIKQVSDRCGFCSPSQFGRVFKRLIKQTPGIYRYKKIVPGIDIM